MVTSDQGLAEVMAELARANDDLLRAAGQDDRDEMADLMRRVASLEKQRNRLLRGAGTVRTAPLHASVPLRDQVIRTLRLGGRPMSTRLLADLARARFDAVVPTPKLSSLRRDEANSWTAAHSGAGRTAVRDVYVLPALAYDRFAPLRGALALSSWPLEDRIVAPASPRVDMLRVTLSLADELAGAPDGAPWTVPLSRLLWRLARTVPGLGDRNTDDLPAVRDAVLAELAELDGPDRHERRTAGNRAKAVLDEYTLLFGTATARTAPNAKEA